MQAHVFRFRRHRHEDRPAAGARSCSIATRSRRWVSTCSRSAPISRQLGGNFVNRFNIAGRSYKVIPQIKRVDRLNPEQLKNIYVTGPNDQLVPLSTVATIKHKTVARSLNRMQQLNAVTISGVPARSLDAALKFLEDEARKILPQGYAIDYTGESRQLRTEGEQVPRGIRACRSF